MAKKLRKSYVYINGERIELVSLTKSEKRKIERAKREWNKAKREAKKIGKTENIGTLSTRKYRINKTLYGGKEARRLLEQNVRYSQGLAYSKNIQMIYSRLEHFEKAFGYDLSKLKWQLKHYQKYILEDEMKSILQVIYKLDTEGLNEEEIEEIKNELKIVINRSKSKLNQQ